METPNKTSLQIEWQTLQAQHEHYEAYSLIIKLFSIGIASLLLFHQHLDFIVPILCAILWMLDGIWKTFQSRLFDRLLEVENALIKPAQDIAMQFNSTWLLTRPSSIQLIASYIKNALSPTVMVPHLCVIGVTGLAAIRF